MTNYTKFAVKGTITVLVISLLAAFLGYLVRFILARNLTVEDFGLFNSIFAFLAMLGIFKSLGFDKALIYFIPKFKHENRNDLIKSSIIYSAVIQLITNFIVIIAIYLLSSYLSIKFFHSPKSDIVLKLMAIAFFVDSFVQILKFAFQGFKEMTYFSGIDLVRMLLILIIIIIGFKLNYGLLSPIIAYVITPLILIFIFGLILTKKVFPEFAKSKFILSKNALKRISKYSIFLVESNGAGLILYYTDIMALTYFSTLVNVGLYSVALPTAKVLMYFPRAIHAISMPLTAELWSKGEKKLLKMGIEDLYKYSFIIAIPAVFILFSFADLLIAVLYGKDYILAALPMKILSIGMLFEILSFVNWSFFSGIGEPRINSKALYYAAIFNLIGNLILIPMLGMNGAAIATALSSLIILLYGFMKIRGFIKVRFPLKIWIKNIFAGILFVLIIIFLKKILVLNVWTEAAIVVVLAALCYLGLLFMMKIINLNELKSIYTRLTAK